MLRRNEGTCPSSPSDDEVGELEGTIRAERAKRAEQSNRSSQAERVVEAGVSGGQNRAADDPRRTLLHGDDLGLGKCRDRQPVGDALFDRCHQMRAQGTQVAAQHDGVRIDDTNNIVDRIPQGTADTLEHLEHRSLAFIYGLDDLPDRFLRSFVDQPSRLISGQQVAGSQQAREDRSTTAGSRSDHTSRPALTDPR